MPISAADKYLEENPHVERLVNGAPSLVSTAMGATTKPDAGFRDLLKEIKKKNSEGISKSDINTF